MAFLAALAGMCAGCGGGDGSSSGSASVGSSAATVSYVRVPVVNARGATLSLSNGLTVIIPAGALSGDALVTLAETTTTGISLFTSQIVPVGGYALLDLGGAHLVGDAFLQANVPAGMGTSHVVAQVYLPDGTSVPLNSVVDDNGRLTATLDATTGMRDAAAMSSTFVVGLLDSTAFDARQAHVEWPSYNVYLYTVGGGANGSNAFVEFIHQGQLVASVPDLGLKPLMLLHGLGGAIHNGQFDRMAEYMRVNGSFTSIIGFEYDSLAPISTNGQFCRDLVARLNAPPFRQLADPQRQWSQLGHSMGTLVTRTAFELQGQPVLDIQKANVILQCSPSLGTQVAVNEQDFGTFKRMLRFLALNRADMDWTNADGQECQVSGMEQGFTDLRPDRPYIQALNANVQHPQATYRIMAAGTRKNLTNTLDSIVGCYMTDGLVDLASATTTVTGWVDSYTLTSDDHFTAMDSANEGYPKALQFFNAGP